jgi:hypothetical protein
VGTSANNYGLTFTRWLLLHAGGIFFVSYETSFDRDTSILKVTVSLSRKIIFYFYNNSALDEQSCANKIEERRKKFFVIKVNKKNSENENVSTYIHTAGEY